MPGQASPFPFDELLEEVLLELEEVLELEDEQFGLSGFLVQSTTVSGAEPGISADRALAFPTTLSAIASTRQPVPR